MEHIPESIQAIMARMGERYFAIPAEELVGAAQPTSPQAPSVATSGTPHQAPHETTTVPSLLFPGALADYIPAEVFLENMGFFTPSSKKIQTPPDLVVKIQPIDIIAVILWLVLRLRIAYQWEIKG